MGTARFLLRAPGRGERFAIAVPVRYCYKSNVMLG
jgi:hypothetical protein